MTALWAEWKIRFYTYVWISGRVYFLNFNIKENMSSNYMSFLSIPGRWYIIPVCRLNSKHFSDMYDEHSDYYWMNILQTDEIVYKILLFDILSVPEIEISYIVRLRFLTSHFKSVILMKNVKWPLYEQMRRFHFILVYKISLINKLIIMERTFCNQTTLHLKYEYFSILYVPEKHFW